MFAQYNDNKLFYISVLLALWEHRCFEVIQSSFVVSCGQGANFGVSRLLGLFKSKFKTYLFRMDFNFE